MSQLDLFAAPPTTHERDWHKYMARVYLAQARSTPHRDWCLTLLEWAANRRRLAGDRDD